MILKMNHFPLKCYSPLERKNYEVWSWKADEHSGLFERTQSDMPWNMHSIYTVQENKYGLFGEKIKKIVHRSCLFKSLNEFERFGFDSRPANQSEFLDLVTRVIDKAEIGKYLHIIGVASPTGWDEKMLEEFNIQRHYPQLYQPLCFILLNRFRYRRIVL